MLFGLRVAAIIQGLVTNEDHDECRYAVQTSKNAVICAPADCRDQPGGDERPEEGSAHEEEGPYIDAAGPLVKEEPMKSSGYGYRNIISFDLHIMDHTQTDNLWRGVHPTLERSERSEARIVR